MKNQLLERSDSKQVQHEAQTRAFIVAWAFTVVFYFLEYAVRSCPSVMIPELQASFHTTALGISAILGVYYYTYSSMSLIAGAALDHIGAKRTIPIGVTMLGVGCLLFSAPTVLAGNVGRLLQGAGSAFAFTGAVYLAARGFPARYLATAIGATQCVGMLGGSAGQFLVGPMIERGVSVQVVWLGLGAIILANALLLYIASPKEQFGSRAQRSSLGSLLEPYKVVFSNPQSYLCGAVAGLLFAPTTIGDMIWGGCGISKGPPTLVPQRCGYCFHGSPRLGCRMPAPWLAFRPCRPAKTGNHGERGDHDRGRRSNRTQAGSDSGEGRNVHLRHRIWRRDDSVQRDQGSQPGQRER